MKKEDVFKACGGIKLGCPKKDMFAHTSGFDAPAYGEPLPAGAKLVKQDNGRLKIVMPGEE